MYRGAFGDILFASSGKKNAKNAAKTKVLEIAEAPPAADEARRFRGSVPIGGHVVAGNRLTRRCSGQTILHLGHVLPIPYLPTEKEVKKPCGFLHIFGYFLCALKVPRRRHGHADSIASPQLKHRNPISDRRRKPSRRAEDPGGGSFHTKTAKNSTRRAAGCRAPCALEGMERKIAN